MQKILVMMMTFALTVAAQAEKIDSTQFVAFYNYTIQTQDDEGQNVTDSIRLALLVGTRATYCITVLSYNKDGRPGPEMTNAFSMHHQNVLTDVERSEVVAVEPIYPYRYETHEPMAKIDWTLTEDTLTISGLPCHRATADHQRTALPSGHGQALRQAVDGVVHRGNALVGRSVEVARTAGTDYQSRGC